MIFQVDSSSTFIIFLNEMTNEMEKKSCEWKKVGVNRGNLRVRRGDHTQVNSFHTRRGSTHRTQKRETRWWVEGEEVKNLCRPLQLCSSHLLLPMLELDYAWKIFGIGIFFSCVQCAFGRKTVLDSQKKNAANQRLDDKRLNTRQRGPHTSAARLGSLKRSLSLISSETLLCGNCAAIKNEILMGKDPLLSRFYVAFPYTAAEQL